MIGDLIKIKPEFLALSEQIIEQTKEKLFCNNEILSLAIGGESGCGKSTLALSLQKKMHDIGIKSIILHQDDYFKLPPKTNHKNRKTDLNNVGPKEVYIDKLDEDIKSVKQKHSDILVKPLVHYDLNVIRKEFLKIEDVQVIIAEGTYTMLLQNADIKIFFKKNFIDTKANRILRGRDELSGFNERVLMIEHEIIRKHAKVAHFLVDNDLNISPSEPSTELGEHLWV